MAPVGSPLSPVPTGAPPDPPPQVFVKCHFDYDPASDSLIPCKEAGLRFAAGDLLQIVNQDDPNWWQVRGGGPGGAAPCPPPPDWGPPAAGGCGGLGCAWGWGGSCGEGSLCATRCPLNPRGGSTWGVPRDVWSPFFPLCPLNPRGTAGGVSRDMGSPCATPCPSDPRGAALGGSQGSPCAVLCPPSQGCSTGVSPGTWGPHVPLCPPQACHVEGGSAGLIPSQLLEEKRKAFVKRDLEVPPASGTVPNPPPQPPRQCPRAVALSPAPAQASLCPRQGPCAAASAGGGRRG